MLVWGESGAVGVGDLGRVARIHQHQQLEPDQRSGYHQRIGGGGKKTHSVLEGAPSFPMCTSKTKASKVAMHKGGTCVVQVQHVNVDVVGWHKIGS